MISYLFISGLIVSGGTFQLPEPGRGLTPTFEGLASPADRSRLSLVGTKPPHSKWRGTTLQSPRSDRLFESWPTLVPDLPFPSSVSIRDRVQEWPTSPPEPRYLAAAPQSRSCLPRHFLAAPLRRSIQQAIPSLVPQSPHCRTPLERQSAGTHQPRTFARGRPRGTDRRGI